MSAMWFLPIMLIVLAISGCTGASPSGAASEQACMDSGGMVANASCCKSGSDFPNTCVIGACGCSPENSKDTNVCDCGEGMCFDGSGCVPQDTGGSGDSFLPEISSFEECVDAGYPVQESYPRKCAIPDGQTFTEEEMCFGPGGYGMTLSEAIDVAYGSECADSGNLMGTGMCNSTAGTWILDLDIQKPAGCNPVCAVDIEAYEAAIDWRCA